jgi:hypothetical protein
MQPAASLVKCPEEKEIDKGQKGAHSPAMCLVIQSASGDTIGFCDPPPWSPCATERPISPVRTKKDNDCIPLSVIFCIFLSELGCDGRGEQRAGGHSWLGASFLSLLCAGGAVVDTRTRSGSRRRYENNRARGAAKSVQVCRGERQSDQLERRQAEEVEEGARRPRPAPMRRARHRRRPGKVPLLEKTCWL